MSELKLKPAAKKKWLRALRSKRYRQAKGFLCVVAPSNPKKVKGYCCLGVFANQVKLPFEITKDPVGKTVRNYKFPHENKTGLLESKWFEKYFKKGHNKVADIQGCQRDLSSLNDNGSRFKTIAKWIEENL